MLEITEEQLAEWMALCDAATPGPWTRSGLFEALNRARTAMPALIAALREARAALEAERTTALKENIRIRRRALTAEKKVKRLRNTVEMLINEKDFYDIAARVLKETE